jgi:uncharacterized protein (UPF0264 family)
MMRSRDADHSGGRFGRPVGAACGLLVSVRDAAEARAAVAGGATIIDVKEPLHGPLGRAAPHAAAEIAAGVGSRRPWTMACGELQEGVVPIHEHVRLVVDLLRGDALPPAAIKAGLANTSDRDWPSLLRTFVASAPEGIEPVAVAYADWQRAGAPKPEELIASAVAAGCRLLLIDTYDKSAPGVMSSPGSGNVAGWIRAAQAAGLWVALAGRLTVESLPLARDLGPDVLAIRSAACLGGRFGAVSGKLVHAAGKLCGLPEDLAAGSTIGDTT